MKLQPKTLEGYHLLHSGAVALAEVEANGIRIDVSRMVGTQKKLFHKIAQLRKSLTHSDVWRLWRRRYPGAASLGSRDQLATLLHGELGFEIVRRTESGRPSMDETALQDIDHPFVRELLRLWKYEKTLNTFVKGIAAETVGDRLHPVFNLHTARTYRSSSDSPNFQNFPVRDKEISKIVRSLFIPSKGCVLVENDFKGIEVCVAACYHKDPNFISYITTPGKDMHRDMAAQIYMLEPSQVSKEARYGAKNKFVFPQFYGDFYVNCARSLWEWISKGKLTGPDGKQPLAQHLASKGIKRLGACDPEAKPLRGTFEHHVREVENDFWNHRFMVYGRWRREWYDAYLRRGFFDILTGFRVRGYFDRNSVVNYPVQGSAFHCLLWSLIRVNELLKKYKMKSRLVGQIHDSMIGDVPVSELVAYSEIVHRVATVEVRQRYPWILVPLEIEYEVTPLGGSWHDKREVKFRDGAFLHPKTPNKSIKNPQRFLDALSDIV